MPSALPIDSLGQRAHQPRTDIPGIVPGLNQQCDGRQRNTARDDATSASSIADRAGYAWGKRDAARLIADASMELGDQREESRQRELVHGLTEMLAPDRSALTPRNSGVNQEQID